MKNPSYDWSVALVVIGSLLLIAGCVQIDLDMEQADKERREKEDVIYQKKLEIMKQNALKQNAPNITPPVNIPKSHC